MVHAVSATFERFERMSPPAAGMALLLHVLVAAFLIWAPTHHPDETDDPIEVTMETPPPPPPPEPKPEPKPETKPEVQKPPPQAAPQPPPPQQTTSLPGLAPRGAIGPKNTAPPMERGLPTDELPPEKAEQAKPKDEAPPPQVLEQQALARLAEPPPPPPPPTLEKELPPVEAPPPPVTARDLPRIAPPVPEKKPEAPRPPPPPQQHVQPPRPPAGPQLQPSPLSRLPRNSPSQQRDSQPRSTFVNPADTYAMNTVAESYQHRVVDQVGRYQANLSGAEPTDTIVVRFTIARNGSLLSVAIAQSSGKPAIDRGLVTAFQTVAPFPPLPPEIPGESATFTLAFGPRFKQR